MRGRPKLTSREKIERRIKRLLDEVEVLQVSLSKKFDDDKVEEVSVGVEEQKKV